MGRAEAGASPGFPQMLRGWHQARGLWWKFWEEAVDCLSILLVVLASRSRGPHPARPVSQARRRGGTFNRSIAQKSAASPHNVQRRKEKTVMKVLIAGASGALGTPLNSAQNE